MGMFYNRTSLCDSVEVAIICIIYTFINQTTLWIDRLPTKHHCRSLLGKLVWLCFLKSKIMVYNKTILAERTFSLNSWSDIISSVFIITVRTPIVSYVQCSVKD